MGWFNRVEKKQLSEMRHAGGLPFFGALLSRTRFDYAKEVGTGIDSSVVTAPVQWLQRAITEAPLVIETKVGDEIKRTDEHDFLALIEKPNGFYSGDQLMWATVFSWCTAGNAYWFKVRDAGGRVRELWYAPHWLVEPKHPDDGSAFISHYEYRPGGLTPMRLDIEDVVHLRHGIDPRNARKGLSPLHGAIREIFTDIEASNFSASLLKNSGVPGVVISPDGGVMGLEDDIASLKKMFVEAFTGDRRGEPLVMGSKTQVQQFGFNPQQMDMSVTRNVAEERVCACLGLPAAVVGFGSGLEQTKVGATMGELRRLAWTNGVIPAQRSIAKELTRSLLPDFRGADNSKVVFDTTDVAALEEDLNTRAARMGQMVNGGVITVAEAREEMGFDVDDTHRVFLRPLAVIEVPQGETAASVFSEPPEEREADRLRFMLKAGLGRDFSSPLAWGEKEDAPTLAEAAALNNRRAHPSKALIAFMRLLEASEDALAKAFEADLERFFEKMGEDIEAVAFDILAPKASAEDALLSERILQGFAMNDRLPIFREIYERHYLNVAKQTSEAMGSLGLAVDLPDPVARSIIATGGRRAGLIDLQKQTLRSLFDALTEGRANEEGAEALARRIRGEVPRGPWRSAATRSRIIARTETKFAQNTSTVKRAQDAGVQSFMVFDARVGGTDETCEALNGIIVTAGEAEQLAADEHPNGTRSFSPYFEE